MTTKDVITARLLQQNEQQAEQVDLPKKLYNIIEHLVRLYVDSNGNIVRTKLPMLFENIGNDFNAILLADFFSAIACC